MKRANDYAIGIDIGGTKIAVGIVDRRGVVLKRKQIPTESHRDGETILADVTQLVQGFITPTQVASFKGIGVSICELVDLQGNVTSDYTVKWKGLPIQQRLSELAPTVVEADVRAHALAEATFGSGRQYRHFIFLSVGTGISSCLVQDGQPYAGARGNALVLTTMPVTVFDEAGQRIEFTLEPFASGAGMVERFNHLLKSNFTRVEEIVAAAQSGDRDAVQVLSTGGEALGSAVGWLVNVLDPEAVIVGGGLGLADGLYWDAFVASTRQHIFAEETRRLPILKAACGADAGIVGAAAKVFMEIGD